MILININNVQNNNILWLNNNVTYWLNVDIIKEPSLHTINTFKAKINTKNLTSNLIKNHYLYNYFIVYFIKKDYLYTKLKYSRVTQYDISSGAIAALFAGFIGFLICEKYGMELIDSGDFYVLFMYLVFLFYSIKLFFKLTTYPKNLSSVYYSTNNFLFQPVLIFINSIVTLLKKIIIT